MKVRRLEMTSFRGFSELALEFQGNVTVLVGVNGAGKTSILDCLAGLLSQVSAVILGAKTPGNPFDESDIQNGQDSTQNEVQLDFGGRPAKWASILKRKVVGRPTILSRSRVGQMVALRETASQPASSLSIYYRVNRAPEIPSRIKTSYTFDPMSAFEQALEGGGGSFRLFFEWFRDREDVENERRLQQEGLEYRDPQLNAVRTAIERLVPGFTNLRMQRVPQRMLVEKEGGTLEVDQLSGGEKSLLAMTGDLARRLAIANPSLEDPLLAEAVVLIDEVELHLHPGWQRMVVERLQQTFPHCQFILTTHSPQVLSQVPTESVILLERFQRAELPAATLGRDSNSILAEVMGVPERPPAMVQRLHQVARMIDSGELPAAREALAELARQLGQHDSEVVRLRSLLDFLGG